MRKYDARGISRQALIRSRQMHFMSRATRSLTPIGGGVAAGPGSASISARTRFTLSARISAVRSCYGKSGRAAKWKRGLPTCSLAWSAWNPTSTRIISVANCRRVGHDARLMPAKHAPVSKFFVSYFNDNCLGPGDPLQPAACDQSYDGGADKRTQYRGAGAVTQCAGREFQRLLAPCDHLIVVTLP